MVRHFTHVLSPGPSDKDTIELNQSQIKDLTLALEELKAEIEAIKPKREEFISKRLKKITLLSVSTIVSLIKPNNWLINIIMTLIYLTTAPPGQNKYHGM